MACAEERTDETPGVIWIGLAHGSEAEAATASSLRAALNEYDLEPWLVTRSILIDENAIPYSHPILTIHTRYARDTQRLVATVLHEQLHWLEDEPWLGEFRAAMQDFERLFPEVPSSAGGGARDDESTYRHLLVCDLEYQAASALLGESAAKEILAGFEHYQWIYEKVLNDPRIREVALRHGFDVSRGVPRSRTVSPTAAVE